MRKYEHGGNIYGRKIRLDFSVNTNPLGLDDNIKNAVFKAADNYSVYPDTEYRFLRKKIAEYEGVDADNIVVSNGASEMIFAVVRALMPKKAVLVSPTFSEYERALLSVGCKIVYYNLKEENDFKITADILNYIDGVDMLFICNPNNPTGALCDEEILNALLKDNITCIMDECFIDFTEGKSMRGKMPVIKAFTKTHAMAGLRMGYMICGSDFAETVLRQLPMWNVSVPAQAAAVAATKMKGYLKKSREIIKREREYLTAQLSRMGFKVFKSDANFLLVKGNAGIGTELLRRGILIRECDNFKGLDGRFYRIAVKTHPENEILIKELGDILG